MRKKIVAGNWKMNTTVPAGVELAKNVLAKISEVPEGVKLVVAPPFTHLSAVESVLNGSAISVSAQNCADQVSGAYTGEVSVDMLKSINVEYVILGHSERREYYGETNQLLVKKMELALAAGLSPIYCVGEKLEEREADKHFEVVESQLKEALFGFTPEQMANIVIAYEPVWAIGTGKTASSEQAQEIHAFIRKCLADQFGELAEEISILYGGSCKPSNAPELFAQADIDGGLIGGAALAAEDFIGIAVAFAK